MASIHDLSPDLLQACFEPLYSEKAPTSLRQLNLVCHSFHAVASRLLFKEIRIFPTPCDSVARQRSIALIAFLQNRPDLQSHVKSITLSGCTYYHQNAEGACQDALEALLPKLPHLRIVKLLSASGRWRTRTISETYADRGLPLQMCGSGAGAAVEAAQRAKGRPIRPSLLTLIDSLNVGICLSDLDYVQDPQLLDNITHLRSLNVQLLSESGQSWSIDGALDDPPSILIAGVVRRNPYLRHLGIRLDHANARNHPFLAYERQHALENLVTSPNSITSVSLAGDLSLSHDAWTSWSKCMDKIHSLHMRGPCIIQCVVEHSSRPFPALRRLLVDLRSLMAEPSHSFRARIDRAKFTTDLKSFVDIYDLQHLSLVGFDSRAFPGLGSRASQLTSLCFHQLLTATYVQSHVWLSTDALRDLLCACNGLEYLAIDIPPFNLIVQDGIRVPVPYVPKDTRPPAMRRGPPRQILEQYEQAEIRHPPLLRHADEQDSDGCERPAQTTDAEEQQFLILAAHRSLRHLRLFHYTTDYFTSAPPSWDLSITDAIYAFLYFRSEKSSCKLQSLVIHATTSWGVRPSVSFVIEALGDYTVHVHLLNQEQVWDVWDCGNLKLVSSLEVSEERSSPAAFLAGHIIMKRSASTIEKMQWRLPLSSEGIHNPSNTQLATLVSPCRRSGITSSTPLESTNLSSRGPLVPIPDIDLTTRANSQISIAPSNVSSPTTAYRPSISSTCTGRSGNVVSSPLCTVDHQTQSTLPKSPTLEDLSIALPSVEPSVESIRYLEQKTAVQRLMAPERTHSVSSPTSSKANRHVVNRYEIGHLTCNSETPRPIQVHREYQQPHALPKNASQHSFPLMKLPKTVINHIISILLETSDKFPRPKDGNKHTVFIAEFPPSNLVKQHYKVLNFRSKQLSILSVCKELRHEAQVTFQKLMRFRFTTTSAIDRFLGLKPGERQDKEQARVNGAVLQNVELVLHEVQHGQRRAYHTFSDLARHAPRVSEVVMVHERLGGRHNCQCFHCTKFTIEWDGAYKAKQANIDCQA